MAFTNPTRTPRAHLSQDDTGAFTGRNALRLKVAVVQHKAIRYAARQGQAFEVAAPGGNDGTNVSDFETKFYGQ